jgi:glycosyltransferase involved in cell wall biosynthesis
VKHTEREVPPSGNRLNRGLMRRAIPLSVIVSTCDAAATLGAALVALRASDLGRNSYEIIVVDDASADASVAIAARHADTVVRLSGRRAGPAYARNRGVELARGEIVAFVDADVVVRPDTLSRMLATLREHPDVDAVSACRDHSSPPGFVSQYWNVLLSFSEQGHSGRCAHFATGCGAVRRAVFVAAGMYDEWRFATPSLEGVELGERLVRRGSSTVMKPDVTVAHLKAWTVGMVGREVWIRSALLARSLGYSRMSALAPGDLVITLSRALAPSVALLGTLMLAAAFVPAPHAGAEAGLAVPFLVLTNLRVHRFFARTRGLGFAVMAAPVHIFVQGVAAAALCSGWILRYLVGDVSPDATTQAYSEVGLEIWPPVPRKTPTFVPRI